MNLIEETRWSIERAKEAACAVFAIPEAEKISESLDRCLEAYREKKGEPESSLTLGQLKQMNHSAIWVKILIDDGILKDGYALIFGEYATIVDFVGADICYVQFEDYGREWIAYAHKPEGSETP